MSKRHTGHDAWPASHESTHSYAHNRRRGRSQNTREGKPQLLNKQQRTSGTSSLADGAPKKTKLVPKRHDDAQLLLGSVLLDAASSRQRHEHMTELYAGKIIMPRSYTGLLWHGPGMPPEADDPADQQKHL